MTIQSRAIALSLAVHACAFTLILIAGMFTPRSKAMVLDFSLGNSLNAGQAVKQVSAAREQKTVTPTVKDEQSVPIVKDRTEEAVKPISEQPKTSKEEAAGSDSSASSSIGSAEAAKAGYLAAHFIFIRDKIFKNLGYPLLARKMGWEGKVTVAFTVCPDGSVEDISVVGSSGFAALDRSAVDAIKRSRPLPRPPLKTALIMPVVYRLE